MGTIDFPSGRIHLTTGLSALTGLVPNDLSLSSWQNKLNMCFMFKILVMKDGQWFYMKKIIGVNVEDDDSITSYIVICFIFTYFHNFNYIT